jgi:hypothetical protein
MGSSNRPSKPYGFWVAIGMAIGIGVGVALNHLAIGMVTGIAIGAGIGFIHQWKDKQRPNLVP